MVFVKFNENRKFLLSSFCVYKTQNGEHARFYINAIDARFKHVYKILKLKREPSMMQAFARNLKKKQAVEPCYRF